MEITITARTAVDAHLVVLGLIFNIIIIIVFCRGNRCSTKNYQAMILNMSAASLITALITCIWLFTMNGFPGTSLHDGKIQCVLFSVLFLFSWFAIPYAIVAIALERALITFFPKTTNQKTTRIVVLIVAWLMAVLASCEVLLRRQHKGKYCQDDYERVYGGNSKIPVWIIFITYLLPAVGMLVLTIAVCAKSCRNRESNENQNHTQSTKKVG